MLSLIEAEAETNHEFTERAEPRYRVLLSAKLIGTTQEQPVKVRDLSATGAMIEGAKIPAAGTDVILRRGALELFATVAWVKGNRGGLHFYKRISETELWTQIHRTGHSAPVEETAHHRPGFRAATLTPEEAEAAAAWARPQGRAALRD